MTKSLGIYEKNEQKGDKSKTAYSLKKIKAGESGKNHVAKIVSEEEPRENDTKRAEERFMNY